MPVDKGRAHRHGRVLKAISEYSSLLNRLDRFLNIRAGGAGAVEEETIIVSPDLNIAGHGFAVKAEVPGFRAEEHVEELFLLRGDFQLVFITVDLCPASIKER